MVIPTFIFALALSAPALADEPAPVAGTRKHIPPRLSFLDNGEIKLGVDLALGGALTYLGPAKSELNVINSWDFGRQVQMSFYSGPIPFVVGAKRPPPQWRHLGWNPIQTGDDYGHASRVLEHKNDGKDIYVKCVPLQWPLDNVPGECTFEWWLRLDGPAVKIRGRLNNQRSDKTQYAGRPQELPAVYVNGPYHRLMSYTGARPCTGGALTELKRTPETKGPWLDWPATERWAAHVDDAGWGLGVWHAGSTHFGGGFAGRPGAGGPRDEPTGYITPQQVEILDHNIRFEFETTLILGKLDAIRAYVVQRSARPAPPRYRFADDRQSWHYAHARDAGWPIRGELDAIRAYVLQRSAKPAPPRYRFADDRQSWHYAHARDAGWPIRGELDIALEQPDPQLIGPFSFWYAEDAPKLRIEAAFTTRENTAEVFWAPLAERGFSAERRISFPIQGDGEYRVYEVDLGSAAGYRGAMTRLRIDPIPNGHANAHVRVRRIELGK